jgi:hypothetical protein
MENIPVTNSAAGKLSTAQLKTQLDSYLGEQPEAIRSFHQIMKTLETVSFALVIVNFITALVLSFMWKSIPVQAIPTAWLLLPVTAAFLILLIAVHSLVLRAFPSSGLYAVIQRGSVPHLPGKSQEFVTGKAAVSQAWGLLIIGLIAGAFFAVFAWSAWTVNWAILTPMITILGIVMGIVIAASIVGGMLFSIYQKFFKSR